jgi:hypothetical protein
LPEARDDGEYLNIRVKEANSVIAQPGKPALPVFSTSVKFPLGTKIENVECMTSEIKIMDISKKIKTVPQPEWLIENLKMESFDSVYDSIEPFPSDWYSYKMGGGIDEDNNHVLFLSIHIYPVRYIPAENVIQYIDNVKIKVTYEEKAKSLIDNKYNMIIVTPSEFSSNLQELVDHKNSCGVKTVLVNLIDIYDSKYFPVKGRDNQEKIKYFIKDAIENWGIKYVLLVGSIDKLPIRTTWIFQRWHKWYWNETILSDLYYADIYDANGDFCSWDSNNNGIYGERHINCPGVNDTVDLYPDVNIGRLACKNKKEVGTVVDKIIHYETETYGESWFNNIILCGGDTFPDHNGNEGEEKNKITEQIMSGFVPTRLWTSDNTFSPRTINRAINNGAGFVDYSGHGFEYGVGTHPPDDEEKWIFYLTPYLFGLHNGYKLPIIFFDACLTAKLDFVVSDILTHIHSEDIVKLVHFIANVTGFNMSKRLPCFAWCCVKNNGGAIATIGATRTAYGSLEMGCGYLSIQFYEAYSSSETVSQMLTKAQNDYINNLWRDYFTLEEFILLGDPSLEIGGYPN